MGPFNAFTRLQMVLSGKFFPFPSAFIIASRREVNSWPLGKIKIAEIHDNNIGRNADELLRKVEAAQFVAEHPNEVCPAKWKKGANTLKPSIDLVGKI